MPYGARAWCLGAVTSLTVLLPVVGPAPVPAGLLAPPRASAQEFEEEDRRTLEQTIGTFTRDVLRGVRRFVKQMYWSLTRVAARWQRWLRRLVPFIPIVVVAALADRGLLLAWREQGLRVLTTYVPLMLYVYLRLLFTPRVRFAGKLALAAALAYALIRHDLVTDRLPIPGYLDDAVLIIAATRFFLYTCPEELVSSFAQQAISWRRRVVTLQRARQR